MLAKQQNKTRLNFFSYKLKVQHSKKKEKRIDSRQTLKMDPQETNPIYNHLRQSRTNQYILEYILGLKSSTQSLKKVSIKRRSYSPNFAVFQKHSRNISSQQIQRFRSQGEDIYMSAGKMSVQLKRNKKKFSILGQYNDLVDQYCQVVPKIKTQTDKQLLIAHKQIQKLCTEQDPFKGKDIVKRASFFKHYEQPKVNFKVMKKSKKVASIHKPLTSSFDEQLFPKNNTLSF